MGKSEVDTSLLLIVSKGSKNVSVVPRLYTVPKEHLSTFWGKPGGRCKKSVCHRDQLRITSEEVDRYERKEKEFAQPHLIPDTSKNKIGGKPKSPFTEAIEKAYLHFMETGNTEILKPERRADFTKSLMELVKNENWNNKGNENISVYISERIKGQKTKNGHTFIVTQEYQPVIGKNAGKTMTARDYSMGEVSKALNKLRDKYPLPA